MTALLAALLVSLSAQLSTGEAAAAPSGNDAAVPTNPFATTPTESAATAVDSETPAAQAAASSDITLPPASAEPTPVAASTQSLTMPSVPPTGATTAPGTGISQTATDADGAAAFATAAPAATTPIVSATTPAAPETSVLSGGPKPAEFMRRLLSPPAAGQLPGIALTLGDAMAGAVDRVTQTQRAEAYWDLCAAVGQYYVAVSEAAELASLRQAVLQPATAWDVAAADIAKRVEQTRQTATTSQLRLHRIMGATAGASLPLPADAPHCGRYNTRYDEIFVSRMDPAARQLDEMLPLLHGQLVSQVRLIVEAKEWLDYVSEHRDPKTDGVGLLRAYELMALRRREFVETAHQYNLQIAAYTELAAPDQVESARLVSMLIRVSNPGAGLGPSGTMNDPAANVSPASATEPVGGAASDADGAAVRASGAPRTFAWRPFERLRNRERSIVTSRRLLWLPFRDRDQN